MFSLSQPDLNSSLQRIYGSSIAPEVSGSPGLIEIDSCTL